MVAGCITKKLTIKFASSHTVSILILRWPKLRSKFMSTPEIKVKLDVSARLTFAFDASALSKQENDYLLPFDDLKRRAEAGDTSAQYLMAVSLIKGLAGCTIDKEGAAKWIELAKKNADSPAGQCALGLCYETGLFGVSIKNKDKAKELYTKAAFQKYIPAIYCLAWMMGSEEEEAEDLIRRNAHWSVVRQSIAELALAHKETRKTIINMMETCVELNYPLAQNYLAICYENGWCVTEDHQQAVKLYTLAAKQGVANSRYALGIAYENGNGVEKNAKGVRIDIEEAKKWYGLAAGQGHEGAQRAMKRLNSECCNIS